MKLFICIDDEGGMAFMGRRVSRDRAVTEDIALLSGERLAVFPYSERLFKEAGYFPLVITDADGALAKDSCLFVEDRRPSAYLDKADVLVIYRWNRLYPSDLKIDFSPAEAGYVLTESVDMVGKSHEKITRETYSR